MITDQSIQPVPGIVEVAGGVTRSPLLSPVEQASQFLTALFGAYVGSQETIEIRTFWPDWRPGPRKWFPITRNGVAACSEFAIQQREQTHVFMGVLPHTNGGGRAEHLRDAAWIWCDFDPGDASLSEVKGFMVDCHKERGLPEPDMLVVSGGGYHAYWRVKRFPVNTDQARQRLRKVMERLGLLINGRVLDPKDSEELAGPHACPKAMDAARILRVPGTFNLKQRENPRLVRLVRCEKPAEIKELGWWEGRLPALPLPPEPAFKTNREWKRREGQGGPSLFPATINKIATGAVKGGRHYAMVEVAVAARKSGYDEQEIRAFVEQTGVVSGVPMADFKEQRHLSGIVDWTMSTVQPDYTSF